MTTTNQPAYSRRGFLRATGGSIAVSGSIPSIELVAPPEPDVEWTLQVANGKARLTAIVDGIAYVGGHRLLAIGTADGNERWRVGGNQRVEIEAVGDGTVYLDRDGDLQAHDAATGDRRWSATKVGTPGVHDGTVFAVKSGTGSVVALDAADGTRLWTADGYVQPLTAPTVDEDGTLYVGDEGELHALDAATGEHRWTFDAGGDGFVNPALTYLQPYGDASPTTGGVLPTWSASGGTLYGLSAANGAVQWRVDNLPGTNSPPVAHHEDTLFVGGTGALAAHQVETGDRRWRYSTGGTPGRPRIAGDAIYASDGSTVHAVDAATGTQRWRRDTDSERPAHLGEVADGLVPVSSFDGWVAGLDAADSSERWRYEHGSEPAWYPQLVDESVYLGTRDGQVMALSDPDVRPSPVHRLVPLPVVAGLGAAGVVSGLCLVGYRRVRRDSG